jgi:hypothetical protein
MEAVIPLEIVLPTTRIAEFVAKENKSNLQKDLELQKNGGTWPQFGLLHTSNR